MPTHNTLHTSERSAFALSWRATCKTRPGVTWPRPDRAMRINSTRLFRRTRVKSSCFISSHINPPDPVQRAGIILCREFLAAPRPPFGQKPATTDCRHTLTKAMPAFANQSTWLVGAFHPSTSINLLPEMTGPAGPKSSALYTLSMLGSQRRLGPGEVTSIMIYLN